MFRKVMSKHSDRRKVVKRSTTDYQANLLIVIAISTWIGWTLDEQRSNKTKSHTHKDEEKKKHYCPKTNHNQVNPYPNL